MTSKRMKLIPAVARLDNKTARKPTRQQRLEQHRQAQAWQRKSNPQEGVTPKHQKGERK
jgi:hypothetical protein